MSKSSPTPCAQCGVRPKRPGSGQRRCQWCWLPLQPAEVQRHYAELRLALVPEHARRRTVPASQWQPGHRFCAGCQSMVPLAYVRGSRCIACASTASHRSMVARVYGLKPGQWTFLFRWQDGRCGNAGCRAVSRTKRPQTDHDHVTGAPRGLLCLRCNGILGDVEGGNRQQRAADVLRGLADYLDNPPAVRAGLVAPAGDDVPF